MTKMPTISMITKAIPKPNTYVSVIDAGASGSVGGVGASFTFMAVSAYDGQYDSEPSKEAMTLYRPGTSGMNAALYMPLASVVALATS